jgi:hypothetical protein
MIQYVTLKVFLSHLQGLFLLLSLDCGCYLVTCLQYYYKIYVQTFPCQMVSLVRCGSLKSFQIFSVHKFCPWCTHRFLQYTWALLDFPKTLITQLFLSRHSCLIYHNWDISSRTSELLVCLTTFLRNVHNFSTPSETDIRPNRAKCLASVPR